MQSDVNERQSSRVRRGPAIQWEVDDGGGDFEDDDYRVFIVCVSYLCICTFLK